MNNEKEEILKNYLKDPKNIKLMAKRMCQVWRGRAPCYHSWNKVENKILCEKCDKELICKTI